MNLTPSSAALLGEAFSKIVSLYSGEEDQLVSTDFYFQPLHESGKLTIFNDNDEEIACVADLLLVDDDTLLVKKGLLAGLDEELNRFIEELLGE